LLLDGGRLFRVANSQPSGLAVQIEWYCLKTFASASGKVTGAARIAATLANTGKQVQSLFTLAHAQFALTNSLLQYVLTCVVEPPEEVLPAARARAKARYANILRLAGEEVATRNQTALEQVLEHSKQQ